jgi:hypothetical protein
LSKVRQTAAKLQDKSGGQPNSDENNNYFQDELKRMRAAKDKADKVLREVEVLQGLSHVSRSPVRTAKGLLIW